MGVLLYGDKGMQVILDDRTLAHVEALISARLARSQPFFLWWRDSRVGGDGQSSVWISRTVPVMFRYASSEPVELNPDWLEELVVSADRPGGAVITAEPGTLRAPRGESSVRTN